MLIFDSGMDQNNLSAFGEILLFVIGGALFIIVTLFVSRIVRPNRPNPEKLSTYESGEEPVSAAWSQFNVRFYIIALIFLLFEAEVVFLFPWSTIFADEALQKETHGQWGWLTMIEMLVFIVILALGLAYAWVHGHLDWIKPDPKPTKIQSPVPTQLYQKINERFAGVKPASSQNSVVKE
jgi:NADH-quinone oxidoreductase subunit A